jgi:diaminopimelate decarboxylase/diaminopimelate epimerase
MRVEQRLGLFPDTASVKATPSGERLSVGGCDLADLAGRYNTPLYLYDRATLDGTVQRYQQALGDWYPGRSGITYAGKAFLCVALAQWTQSHDLWIDCTGIGEVGVAVAAGVPRAHVLVHGVNKSPADLEAAVAHAGTIVIDNLLELDRLAALAREGEVPLPDLWLRLRPGLAVETHAYTQTGQADSKFGMSPEEIRQAVEICRDHSLPLSGLHFHQGSHFHDPTPIAFALDGALDLMVAARAGADWALCVGGGWAVSYHEDELPQPDVEAYVRFTAQNLVEGCRRRGISLPRLQLEPGRSLVARAGVAVYRVGTIKRTPGRRWALLDGGLCDNPRPALYGARYSALPVWEPRRPATGPVWLGGPYCESSDILIEALPLPDLQPGELIAIPAGGAYQLSMSSNYNGACRPAALWLDAGRARLIQARERPEDLVRRDRRLGPGMMGELPGAAEAQKMPWPSAVRFAKYQALGNDYIVVDPADLAGEPTPSQVRLICDRHYGIGSDGVLLGPLEAPGSDFGLRLFNPDGSEFEKSGNGLRIFSRYLWDAGLVRKGPFTIATPGGEVTCVVHAGGTRVTVEMGQVSFDSGRIPVAGPPREVLDETMVVGGRELRFCAATIGNPHCVVLREEVSAQEAKELGPGIERDGRFPNRTNVQFMRVLDRANIQIEIWERGAGYTLASGSSSCAAAAVAHRLGLCDREIRVHMPGGEMAVSISDDWSVTMMGAVAKVCEGIISREMMESALR